MNRIETKEEMVKWAELVNHCTTLQEKIDLQDVWGHSVADTLKELYTGDLETNRHLVTFSLFKCMGEETAFQYINMFSRRQGMRIAEEYIKDTDDSINTRWSTIDRARKGIIAARKQFPRLTNKIKNLQTELNNTRENYYQLVDKNARLNKELEFVLEENRELRADYNAIKRTIELIK
jgi:hypothetical protein